MVLRRVRRWVRASGEALDRVLSVSRRERIVVGDQVGVGKRGDGDGGRQGGDGVGHLVSPWFVLVFVGCRSGNETNLRPTIEN
jgi:hypothetical protein